MYLKKLEISSPTEIIREITFKMGANLVIDDTPSSDTKATGNNVGKTTVLKLIDYCLGADQKIIYTDEENKKQSYDLVKEFLINNRITIALTLSEDISNDSSREVKIERNFLSRKDAIRTINNEQYTIKEFPIGLQKHLFPGIDAEKPTFRQIISHNIRYNDHSITNTLRTLNNYTTDIEYETLYLYLLGCSSNDGDKKQLLTAKIKQEEAFVKRLEKKQTKSAYEIALSMVDDEIQRLNEKKETFNLNEDYENDINELNRIKLEINSCSSTHSKLQIRKTLIQQSLQELQDSYSNIDLGILKSLYKEVKVNVSGIQRTFDDLVDYHNSMVLEKIKFLSSDLPELDEKIISIKNKLDNLLISESSLSRKVTKGDSFEELESIISELNEQYKQKGEYENVISQLCEVEIITKNLSKEIEDIDKNLFSEEFKIKLKLQVDKFNKLFSAVSYKLYGERYALKYDVEEKNGRPVYIFSAFNANLSSGQKQGEILCFDIALTLFSRQENLPTLNFLLNDKKELMHGNQLVNVSKYAKDSNIQLVFSILKDKLPQDISQYVHTAVQLSQTDKLFKIDKII